MGELEEILADLEAVDGEVRGLVADCTEDDLRRVTANEGWQVGVVARHIGLGYLQAAAWLETLNRGEDVTTTGAEIDGFNEANRSRETEPKGKIVSSLEERRGRLEAQIRASAANGLDRQGYFGPAEQAVPLRDVARLSTKHAQRHLASIRATLDGG